jgi:hypothetical protein
MITLRKEESGVLVMELSEHLWPEDLELAIPVVHDVARSYQNPLLLLVDVVSSFDTSPLTFLCQILQPGVLAQNRPSRVAVLTSFDRRRTRINTFKTNTRSRNSLLLLWPEIRGQSLAFVVRDASFIASNSRLIRSRLER